MNEDPQEFSFQPRVINPMKLRRVYLLSADEAIRASGARLRSRMPWLETTLLSNPAAVGKIEQRDPFVLLLDDTAALMVDCGKLRSTNADAVIALLSYNPLVHCAPPSIARREFPYTRCADLVFAVDRDRLIPDRIVTSAVRAAEDFINIRKYSQAQRFIFLVVDDEPRWISQFLPVLYEIIGQRADVWVTGTFEETLNFLFGVEREADIGDSPRGHGDDVVCLIADLFFPRGDNLKSYAGEDLIRLVRRFYPRTTVIIASKAKEALELKSEGFVLPKGDPGSLETLRAYINDFTGIGAFVVRDEAGNELQRVQNIRGLFELISKAQGPDADARRLREILDNYGEKDMFSTWLYMHSYSDLADRLRPVKARGEQMVAVLKRHLQWAVRMLPHTPLEVGGMKIYRLEDLPTIMRSLPPEKLQTFSDNDVISSWLDRKGYSELAEEIRPIHGQGAALTDELATTIERWISTVEPENLDRASRQLI